MPIPTFHKARACPYGKLEWLFCLWEFYAFWILSFSIQQFTNIYKTGFIQNCIYTSLYISKRKYISKSSTKLHISICIQKKTKPPSKYALIYGFFNKETSRLVIPNKRSEEESLSYSHRVQCLAMFYTQGDSSPHSEWQLCLFFYLGCFLNSLSIVNFPLSFLQPQYYLFRRTASFVFQIWICPSAVFISEFIVSLLWSLILFRPITQCLRTGLQRFRTSGASFRFPILTVR
jgi:hypothetical protein